MPDSNDSNPNLRLWTFRDRNYRLGSFPLIMGILNATPDSFSDGGQYFDAAAAVARGLALVGEGADIIDVGGESTRPGSQAVSLEEELRRTIPLIEQLAGQTSAPISIDTTKAEVARQAMAAGAEIINDISGLTFDDRMLDVARETAAGVICMHIQGTPQTMQTSPCYDDVVAEVSAYLADRVQRMEAAGIPSERVVVDPGIGFGKTAEHNVRILSNVAAFRSLGRPVLIGHSRKRFLAKVLGRPVEERSAGTIGVAIAVAAQSADIIRVHDVLPIRDALLAWHTIHDANGKSLEAWPSR
ncbi:MAG: dihydropteroate synthase [Planctomycetota bacterium]|nr:dihydropteroate synthase [Planctomycetota bacterium]